MSVRIPDAQKWLLLTIILACAGLVYLLSPILTPFLVSALLAYLGDPAVDRLQAIKFSRTLSVAFVFFLMLIIGTSVLLIILPLLEEQIGKLITRIPGMIDWAQSRLVPWLSQRFGLSEDLINLENIKQSLVTHWQTLGNLVGKFILKLSASGQFLMLWASYLLLIPVVTFYLLRDWDDLVEIMAGLIPKKYSATVSRLTNECDAVLAEFFRGQLLIMTAQGLFYSVGLWIIGLEFSLLIGLIAGFVSFVPYLGFIVGILIAGGAAMMQFHEIIYLFYVLVVFGIGQLLEGMVLSPLLIGERIGLHPVAVIFAVMAGAQLFGFFGMLLALPVAAVITVLLRYFHEQYLTSRFYLR